MAITKTSVKCITKTHLSLQYTDFFVVVFGCKNENFQLKIMIFFLFLLKTWIVSTHNLCLGANRRKIGVPLFTPVLLYEKCVCVGGGGGGVKGAYITRTCLSNGIPP